MNWFEDQLQYRKETDDRQFREALDSISASVMGSSLRRAFGVKETAQSAIEEILRYYGCSGKEVSFEDTDLSIEERLEYNLRPFGIMYRNVELKDDWYNNTMGAMLGTLKTDGSAVAILPGKLGGYYYHDFIGGKNVKLNRTTAQLLGVDAVCFYCSLPQKKLTIPDLVIFMLRRLSTADITGYLMIMALITALGTISPAITKALTGDIITYGSESALAAVAMFIVCYEVTRLLLSIYRQLFQSKVQEKIEISVQAAIMSRILSLSPAFFKDYSAGELSQRAAYVRALCSTLMSTIANVGISSLFSLVYIAQILQYAPSLVVPSIVITLVTIVFNLSVTFYQMKITHRQMETGAKLSGLTFSTINGIQKIKLAGAEKRMFTRWAELYAKSAELTYNPPFVLKVRSVIGATITAVGTIVVYYIAVKSHVALSDYYAFNTSYSMVSAAFMSLSSIVGIFAQIKPTLEMARPILEAQPETADDKRIITEVNGSIEITDLSFRYRDDMPYVISNLSLKIRSGEYVAICGSTGCGKSTLIRLLLGFEQPERGTIFYDRNDISKVDLKSLRRKIGIVMQNGALFNGDIYSNIAISAPGLSMEGAWEAAEIAGMSDTIKAMPMGMHTLIQEGQGGISGGQKQRIMIARAIASKPKILILDEATSALDNITQKHVSDAIEKLNCTRIVVAHRLSTICHADRIIYLDGGKIAEEGTYEELIAKDGKFAELVKRQRLDVDVK